METTGSYLNVYLGKAKEPWIAYCKALGKKPGAAIREAIEAQLKTAGRRGVENMAPSYTQVRAHDDGPKERAVLSLTPSEMAPLREIADKEHTGVQRLVVSLVRAFLTRQPQFTGRDIELLGESNYQLLAIGRNLNQIAKNLNEGLPESFDSSDVEKLRAEIKAHVARVADAIRATNDRWQIKQSK